MKKIVMHKGPDPDALTSGWLIKKFLQGWEDAEFAFVPAGDKLPGKYDKEGDHVEVVDGVEVIHVDTGLGKLDHHQTTDENVSAASLVYDYLISQNAFGSNETKKEAIGRMVDLIVDDDHFQQVYYPENMSYYNDFSFFGLMDGYKIQNPGDDFKYVEFGTKSLDAILHIFENRIWAENEIKEKAKEFDTKWGKAMAIETMNDAVLEFGQKMGYAVVVKRDTKNGFVRIKARPRIRNKNYDLRFINKKEENPVNELNDAEIDLTPVYEKVKEIDPYASWYLHVSKRMLLNGSAKNPKTIGTKLSLDEIVKVIEDL